MNKRYLSPEEVSNLIGVKRTTLATWRVRNVYNIPFIKVGRKVAYDIRDIEAFLLSRKRGEVADAA